MKSFLKFSLIFSFLMFNYSGVFAQGTCGEIVPFASEPTVDGCDVTYVMDLSIGVNWILYPGNGLPQSSSVSSATNGNNVYTHTYEDVVDVIYPNISYYDEDWNLKCSSFYPVTIECLPAPSPCTFASEPEVDGCCVTYVMDLSIGVNWILQLQEGNNSTQTETTVTSHSNNGSNTVTHCYEPGSETALAFITYIDENWEDVCENSFEITLEDCEPTPGPRCGFASEIVIDGCSFNSSIYSSDFTTRIVFTNPDGLNSGLSIGRDPNIPTTDVLHFFNAPGEYTYTVYCLDENNDIVSTISGSFIIEDCPEDGRARTNDHENIKNIDAQSNLQKSLNVYPNPVSDRLSIDVQNQKIKNIRLFDINNRLLIDKHLEENNLYHLDLSQIKSSGIYYMHVITDGSFYNEMIVIQK